jgi:hypothetical protein
VIGGMGYAQTAYSNASRGNVNVKAGNQWTDVSQSTYISFDTTALGGVVTTERMRINADGSLSVGTTTVAGGFNYQAVATTSPIFSIASSTGANVFRINSNGTVGIGTTSSAFALAVQNGSSNSSLFALDLGTANPGVEFHGTTSASLVYMDFANSLTKDYDFRILQNDNIFSLGASSTANQLVISGIRKNLQESGMTGFQCRDLMKEVSHIHKHSKIK